MSGQKGLAQQSKTHIAPQEVLKNSGQESSPQKSFVRPEFSTRTPDHSEKPAENKQKFANPEFTRIFDASTYRENHDNKARIESLLSQISREVSIARAEGSSITAELTRIENATSQAVPEKVGIYHIEYYGLLLDYVKNIRRKISSAMWYSVARGKQKAKRGSAFASQKSTTDSPEASVARSSN